MNSADSTLKNTHEEAKTTSNENFKRKIVWKTSLIFFSLQILSIYGAYLAVTVAKWQTLLLATVLFILSKIGTTAGAHRLWSHKAFKANTALKIMLMLFHNMVVEQSIYAFARDHRVHHKFQDTVADPYNIREGFFFAHITWILQTKHPEVANKGKGIDVSDLHEDKVVMFQKKYYWVLFLLLGVIMPIFIPWYFWEEPLLVGWFVNVGLRCNLSVHTTSSVNSFAHYFGNKPYDVSLTAVENRGITWLTLGEGWHNYHHAFPWDYRASEIYAHSLTTRFIDLMAKIGWATNLKTAPLDLIKKRALRTGDGTYEPIWGWEDEQEKNEATIINKN